MKNISLAVIALLLVAAIPLTVVYLQNKQQTQSKASASTRFYFIPDSSSTNPLQKNVGDTISLDMMVDPGSNLVTFVRFQVQFDPTIIGLPASQAFVPNASAFPKMVEGPVTDPGGAIAGSLDVGSDPTKAIQKPTKVGTFTFKALAATSGNPTVIKFGPLAQALSSGSNDQAGENVLATATPADIVIGGSSTITPPPGSTGTPGVTISPAPTGQTTTVSFTILLDGIGNRGDNPNPGGSSLSNKNPLHPQRNLSVQIFNSQNQQVTNTTTPIIYDANAGDFTGQLDLGPSFPAGNYNIKVKTDSYLRKLVSGIINIQQLQDNPVTQTALVAGDINGDNILNVLDYNALLDCGFGDIEPLPMADPNSTFNAQVCQAHTPAANVDLDDNGIINSADYNLFIRELSVQNGD